MNIVPAFRKRKESFISITLVFLFLGVWELNARAGNLSKLIFPAPTLIIRSLVEDLIAGKYNENLRITLTRILLGFIIGGGTGLILGMLMGWSRRIRGIFDPIIAGLHPVPKFALLPIVIIFFGLGEQSRIVMVSLGCFFPMVVNAMTGVLQINPIHYEVMENYGASKFDIFRKVVVPGSLPFTMSGARLSLRSALTLTIGIEMVFGNTGLGTMLPVSWNTMRLVDMYAILLIIAILGVGMLSLLERLKRLLSPWHQEYAKDK